jgi:hypothetical protein
MSKRSLFELRAFRAQLYLFIGFQIELARYREPAEMPSLSHRSMPAFAGKADIAQTSRSVRL